MATPFEKWQREQAKRENKYLVQVSIDGRHLPQDVAANNGCDLNDCRFDVTGAMPAEQAQELVDWYLRWRKKVGDVSTPWGSPEADT